ncbi:MAG: hypothetical protein AB9828_01350 [Sphaerochaetaceae bacterium]
MNRYQRLALLVAQVALSVFLITMLFQTATLILIPNRISLDSTQNMRPILNNYIFPISLHIILSLIGSIPLYLQTTSRNDMEKKLLPLLLLVLTLADIRILPWHLLLTGNTLLDPTLISTIYRFSQIFGVFLLLLAGMFQQGLNAIKYGQFLMLGSAISLLVALLAPDSAYGVSLAEAPILIDSTLRSTLLIMEALASLNFIVVYIKESNQQNLIRGLGFLLLILGNRLLGANSNLLVTIAGALAYLAALILLTMIGHSYHI